MGLAAGGVRARGRAALRRARGRFRRRRPAGRRGTPDRAGRRRRRQARRRRPPGRTRLPARTRRAGHRFPAFGRRADRVHRGGHGRVGEHAAGAGALPLPRHVPRDAGRRRRGAAHRQPDQRPRRPHPGLHRRAAVEPVRRFGVRRQPGRHRHGARDGGDDDRHHHGRADRGCLRRPARHDDRQRGDRRPAHGGDSADRVPGPAAHRRPGADAAAARRLRQPDGHLRRRPGRPDVSRHRPVAVRHPDPRGGHPDRLRNRPVQGRRVRRDRGGVRLSARHAVRAQRGRGGRGDDLGGGHRHRVHRRRLGDADHRLPGARVVSAVTDEGAAPHVSVEGLAVGYGDRVVQRGLDFGIRRGSVFVIMGPSGCGKSTVLRAMVGLLEPRAGRIRYGGTSLWDAAPERRDELRRRFGVMYQGGALWSAMTVVENVSLPLEEHTELDAWTIRRLAELKLALVGLSGFEDFYPAEISGGMNKRVGVARALALDPEVVFFDEPSAGLDPISARRLDDTLLALRDALGCTMVLVTHELDSIFHIADDAVMLDPVSGTMIARGAPRELLETSTDERVRRFLRRGEA
ncbi:MAG: ATP-binding cassette domain-containing protein [Gammaproteobacteria bacterium]|nr:ATP-binding cassette domain-containing protein [Gammaproteobacteria bacterium]